LLDEALHSLCPANFLESIPAFSAECLTAIGTLADALLASSLLILFRANAKTRATRALVMTGAGSSLACCAVASQMRTIMSSTADANKVMVAISLRR